MPLSGPRNVDSDFAHSSYEGPSGTVYLVEPVTVGTLNLHTGRLIARDPYWPVDEGEPSEYFSVEVPPGRYPVELLMARSEGSPSDAYPSGAVAAKVTVRDQKVATWEMALRPNWDPGRLVTERAFIGFGVDSGTACFLDESTLRYLDHLQAEDKILSRAAESALSGNGWEVIEDPSTGMNIVLFVCGMGDGRYPTWVGRAANGEVVCFLTDLELLSHSRGPLGD